MSVLTKVFVVLLTVLSISLSMFVIAAFAKQEKWMESAGDWKAAALDAQAKERTVSANAALEQQRALARQLEAERQISELQDSLREKDTDITEFVEQIAGLQNQLTVEQSQVTSAQHLKELIQASFNSEKEFSARLSLRNNELERRNTDLNDRVKELTSQLAMAQSRVMALKEQIAGMSGGTTMASTTGTVQIPGGPGIVQPYTPSVAPAQVVSAMTSPIRGEITGVNGGIAEISVGSADGVAPGMEFMLYRSTSKSSQPEYLGTLRITRVEANRSAGVVEQANGEIRRGDTARDVASFALRG